MTDVFEDLRILRADRISIQQKEKAALDKAISEMETRNLPIYKYLDADGTTRVARLKVKKNVSVRSEKSDDADDEDDGGVEIS